MCVSGRTEWRSVFAGLTLPMLQLTTHTHHTSTHLNHTHHTPPETRTFITHTWTVTPPPLILFLCNISAHKFSLHTQCIPLAYIIHFRRFGLLTLFLHYSRACTLLCFRFFCLCCSNKTILPTAVKLIKDYPVASVKIMQWKDTHRARMVNISKVMRN